MLRSFDVRVSHQHWMLRGICGLLYGKHTWKLLFFSADSTRGAIALALMIACGQLFALMWHMLCSNVRCFCATPNSQPQVLNFIAPPFLCGPPYPQSAPLEEAEMSLKNFEASNGNVRFLETAHSRAMTALIQGHSLDVKLSAAIIAVSAGYVHMSKVG